MRNLKIHWETNGECIWFRYRQLKQGRLLAGEAVSVPKDIIIQVRRLAISQFKNDLRKLMHPLDHSSADAIKTRKLVPK